MTRKTSDAARSGEAHTDLRPQAALTNSGRQILRTAALLSSTSIAAMLLVTNLVQADELLIDQVVIAPQNSREVVGDLWIGNDGILTEVYFNTGGWLIVHARPDGTGGTAFIGQEKVYNHVYVQNPGALFKADLIHVGGVGHGSLWVSSGGRVEAGRITIGGPSDGGPGHDDLTIGRGGTLVTSQIELSTDRGRLLINGGFLQATADNEHFLKRSATQAVEIGNEGVFIDSNDYAIGMAAPLIGSGPLIKQGNGTLTLGSGNTYTGGTSIEGGTLVPTAATSLGTGPVSTGTADKHGTLLFRDGSLSLAHSITGSGDLQKIGSGSLTLDGTNDYTGGTVIETGTISTHAKGIGTGDVFNNGTLAINQISGSATFAGGVISGSGNLKKSGHGTLTLTKANTYTGRTEVSAGTLALSGAGTIGTSRLSLAGIGTFDISNASGAQTIHGLSGIGTVQLGSNSLALEGAEDHSFGGRIQGTGGLTKRGIGTLTLTGSNTYSGGTVVEHGMIVTHAFGLGTGAVSLGQNTSLTLKGTGNEMFSGGPVTGEGWIEKTGSGTIALQQVNTYKGGTIISQGALSTHASGLGTGTVVNNGTLEFWQDAGADATFEGGAISGAGSLTKVRSGKLTLDKENTYTGDTVVKAGTLALAGNGAISASRLRLESAAAFDISAASGARTVAGLTGDGAVHLGGNSLIVDDGGLGSVFHGLMSGTGGIIKKGSGAILVLGQQAYTGDTIIEGGIFGLSVSGELAGNVQAKSGGTLSGTGVVAGSVDIASGATLAGASHSSFRLGALQLGSGAVVDAFFTTPANPVFTVHGNLTLDGRLFINPASTLSLGSFRLFDYGGTLTNNGMVLANIPAGYQSGSFSLKTDVPGRVSLEIGLVSGDQYWKGGSGTWSAGSNWHNPNSSLLTDWRGNTAIFSGASGIIDVQGTQSFSNLRFESDGYHFHSSSSDELAIAGAQGGILVASGATTTLDLPVSGTGKLAKSGGGTLVLSGANTYSGGTWIQAGTLRGSATNFGTGDIENDGILEVHQAQSGTLAANISGSGQLHKTGPGALNLTGTSTMTGDTHVRAGNLAVNGSLGNSLVNVEVGGTLSGTGTVGGIAVADRGIVAPGNSIGTLNVAGHVTFGPGSFYDVEINGAGQSDRIAATGSAALNGGTVRIFSDQGQYSLSPYTILTADAGVRGQFAGAEAGADFAFVIPSLAYGTNTVTLTLVRKVDPQPPTPERPEPPTPVAFNAVAVSANQYRVADAVEALGAGNRLFDAVIGASAAGARQGFDALSGEAHASAASTAITDVLRVQDTLLTRLRNGGPLAQAGDVVPPSFDPRSFVLWGTGFGSWGKIRGDGNAASMDTSTGGFMLGAETQLDGTFRLGIAGGFISTSFDIDGRLSSGTNETVFGSLYGAAKWDAFNLRLGVLYAGHDVDVNRTISFPGFSDRVGSSYDGSTLMAFGEAGYEVDLGGVTLEPFLGASVMRLHLDGFREDGGVAALTGYGRGYDLGTTTLGLRAETQLGTDLPLTLRGMVGWRHAFGDVHPSALLAFSGGASAFEVSGIPVDRNALVAEAGLDWQIDESMTLGVSYAGQIGERAQEHAVKGTFSWRFETR